MTKTFPSLLRLLVVLAMLCSLVAITAAPASAAISAVTCVATPMTAGATASYAVTFTHASNVTAGGTVTVTFPPEVTLPTSIDVGLIQLTGVTFLATSADPTVSGQQVIVTIPSTQTLTAGAGNVLTISQGAGIVNPGIAKTIASQAYPVYVNTSVETTAVAGYMGVIPSYTISPTTGDRNTLVTVTGQGWTASSAVAIGGSLLGTGTADANGVFSLTAVASGAANPVTCTDGAGQSITASTTAGGSVTWDSAATARNYTLKARVTVTPTSGNVGSTFYVLGYDFTTSGNITSANVTLANTAVNANGGALYNLITRDAFGTLDDAYIACTVPDTMTGGVKTLSVTDTGAKVATATFTVNTPTMTLEPNNGAPNTMVTVRGANFKAADTIAIGSLTFAGGAWNTAAITVDSSGNWIYSVRAPTTAVAGNNPIIATTAAGTTALSTFAAGARVLTLNPVTGPKGTKVTVGGSNMTASGSIAVGGLDFGAANWNTTAITIDSQGNVSPSTQEVPTTAVVGANTVTAVDSGALSATGSFTVTQPTVGISPTSGYKGDTITLQGAGWVPGSLGLVTVTFNAVTQLVTTPGTDGTFTAQMAIPVNAVSGQLIGASDTKGNSAASVAFLIADPTITIDPASGPPGTMVTASGKGFQPQSAVTALTIGGGTVLPTTSVVTDALGSFTATFSVPGLASGAQTVSATVLGVSATSFFTIAAAEATVAQALGSIANELIIVWGYTADGWQLYDPADPIGSDLGSLAEGKGYWIKVTEAVTVVYLGKSRSIDPDANGWYMMGW